jgi:hypothetical protein
VIPHIEASPCHSAENVYQVGVVTPINQPAAGSRRIENRLLRNRDDVSCGGGINLL